MLPIVGIKSMTMSLGPLDPRSVCNLMLDEGERFDLQITNLSLQKLLYFAHARYLIEAGEPLVSGYFEAWKYGPVHPAAYKAFKTAGNRPITFRADRVDPLTGAKTALSSPSSPAITRLVMQVISTFGTLPAGRLVDISHARGAPWHFVVTEAQSSMAFGLRISESVILERYKHHKMSVGAEPLTGDPGEDAPFT